MADPIALALAVLACPAGAAFLLGVVPPLRRSGRPAAWLSIAAMGGSLVASGRLLLDLWTQPARVEATWPWIPQAEGALAKVGLLVDPISGIMLFLVSLVAFLVQLYSLGYMAHESPASLGRYYTYHSLFAFSMLGLVAADNFLQLFIFWELVGLCSYLLIGFWYTRPEAARAAVKAFWVTKLGDLGFVIGIVLLWGRTGLFDFASLIDLARQGALDPGFLTVALFCVYLGAVGKSAQFPLHIWLPDAMEGPTPVSALIHAATMVAAGVYLVTRTYPLFEAAPGVLTLIAWVGAFTALLAATGALVQEDIKRVLAYSTVSQLGYMMAALGAGALGAGYYHLFTHGFFKALLFLAAGCVIHAAGTNDLFRMGRLFSAMPQTGLTFLVGAAALAGIWPFAGFFSKEAVLAGVWAAGLTVPFAMLLLTVFLTAFYMVRAVVLAFFGAGEGPGDAHEAPAVMLLPLWILAVLSAVAGVFGQDFEGLVAGEPAAPHAPEWLTPLALALAFAGIVGAWLVYQRRAITPEALARLLAPLDHAARRRYWLDDAFEAGYRGAILLLAALVGWVDRYLVDGLVNVASALTLRAGAALRRMQTGRAQDYLYGVAAGFLFLLILWGSWR